MNISRIFMDIVNSYQLYMSKNIKQLNLGLSEYPLLIFLRNRVDLKISQQDIADALKRDKAIVARSAKSLEEKGYIVSKLDPANKSRKNLYITEAGLEAAVKIMDLVTVWERHIMETLGEDAPEFELLFHKLYDRYPHD